MTTFTDERLGAVCTLCDVAIDAVNDAIGRALVSAFEEQHGHDGILDALEAADELVDAVDDVIRHVLALQGGDKILGRLPDAVALYREIRDDYEDDDRSDT